MVLENIIDNQYIQFLEKQEKTTVEHSVHVSKLALKLGKKIGCSNQELKHLIIGGLLHDIGKVKIDNDLFTSIDLTPRLKEQIHNHTIDGITILSTIELPQEIKEIILLHHERIDGNGYPFQLIGDEIPDLVKIITICDSYSAMISNRIYSKAKSKMEAIEELRNHKGTQFDSDYVELFIRMLEENEI